MGIKRNPPGISQIDSLSKPHSHFLNRGNLVFSGV
jgi:hypothetical protein